MPLNIIRNDITRVAADAIVNTANPAVAVGAGVDSAVYAAAGRELLLAERAKIGEMRPGDVAATPAFGLKAKYIIHTVGPAWEGGSRGEVETVARCYRGSLEKALELGCESVAFPLISSGTYGFPKDVALKTAISEISGFLFANEMTVWLVVYDRESFQVSGKAFAEIQSFVEEEDIVEPARLRGNRLPESSGPRNLGGLPESGLGGYETLHGSGFRSAENLTERGLPGSGGPRYSGGVPESSGPAAGGKAPRRRTRKGWLEKPAHWIFGETDETKKPDSSVDLEVQQSGSLTAKEAASLKPRWHEATGVPVRELILDETQAFSPASIDDALQARDETFQQHLFRIIDRKGLTDPEVYKRANLDRKHFSKIRSNVDYQPSKKTALALAVALGLNLDETRDLLLKAGIALTHSSTFDIIMEYCIGHGYTDIYEINCILFNYDQPTLGV